MADRNRLSGPDGPAFNNYSHYPRAHVIGEHRNIRSIRSVWSAAAPNARLALAYADAGHAVLPVCPSRKSPLTPGGFKTATSDAAQVANWWQRWPDALPALPTADLWVVDVDVRGTATLAHVIGNLAPLLDKSGLEVDTPSGGRHFYFMRKPGVAVPPRASDIAPGIDTRGHGEDGEPRSYIIAPGGIRRDGRSYRIVRGALDEIGTAPRKLLALAHFNKRDRVAIASDNPLRERLNAGHPDCWRAIFDERQAELIAARSRPVIRCDNGDALHRQAVADLDERAQRLASTLDGRKGEAFRSAAAVARYVAAGALAETEVLAALGAAWAACGAAAKHGTRYGAQQIAAGLKIGSRDPLPPIARRFR